MGAMQRNKGKAGEREIASIVRDLTGWNVRRRVRQHCGDSDLCGVPGWSVEVKRHATATRGDLRAWWTQACEQAKSETLRPVLFFRRDRDDWRAVWSESCDHGYTWAIEGSIDAWAREARETVGAE